MLTLQQYMSKTFGEAYLRALRRSDLEVIAEMIVRDVMLAAHLPKEQRVAIANLLRDKADLIERY